MSALMDQVLESLQLNNLKRKLTRLLAILIFLRSA